MAIVCFALSPQTRAVDPPHTPDPPPLPISNTADGQLALAGVTGIYNSAFGIYALLSNGAADFNTGIGAGVLLSNTANEQTAVGAGTLFSNTTGQENTGCGIFALFTNSTGQFNTAVGANSLLSNVDGSNNSALGEGALHSNIHASGNTAIGESALANNDSSGSNTASNNTAVGNRALETNIDGSGHTAVGFFALQNCIAPPDFAGNTAIGSEALFSDTTGNFNTALGGSALKANASGSSNTAIGTGALLFSTGNGNTALGANAGNDVATANNVICIGNSGADVSGTTWISNVFGVTTQSGTTAPVIVSDTGQLGTVASSERFKKDIATMEKASEAILALRPVTFHYKSDAKETPQFGLVAEEVAKVNPALVLPDKEGKPYTVRYDAVNAMLLNEFLKEHLAVQDQGATIVQQQEEIKALKEELKEQASQIQKVSAQLQLRKFATGRIRGGGPEPQPVLNNP